MKNVAISTCGSITFWTPKPCAHSMLLNAATAMGLEKLVPPERTDRSALQHAMMDYGKKNVGQYKDAIVLPLDKPGSNGFECRTVKRGSLVNDTDHWFSAKVQDGQVSITYGYAPRWDLQTLFNEYKETLTSEAVGKFLADAAHNWLPGVCLRPNGGLYWLPDASIDQWLKVADMVERVSESEVTTGLWEANPKTIAVIQNRITDEVLAVCQGILADVQDGNSHSDEYFDKRKNIAAENLKKVEAVEAALNTSLVACRAAIDLAQNVIITTALAS